MVQPKPDRIPSSSCATWIVALGAAAAMACTGLSLESPPAYSTAEEPIAQTEPPPPPGVFSDAIANAGLTSDAVVQLSNNCVDVASRECLQLGTSISRIESSEPVARALGASILAAVCMAGNEEACLPSVMSDVEAGRPADALRTAVRACKARDESCDLVSLSLSSLCESGSFAACDALLVASNSGPFIEVLDEYCLSGNQAACLAVQVRNESGNASASACATWESPSHCALEDRRMWEESVACWSTADDLPRVKGAGFRDSYLSLVDEPEFQRCALNLAEVLDVGPPPEVASSRTARRAREEYDDCSEDHADDVEDALEDHNDARRRYSRSCNTRTTCGYMPSVGEYVEVRGTGLFAATSPCRTTVVHRHLCEFQCVIEDRNEDWHGNVIWQNRGTTNTVCDREDPGEFRPPPFVCSAPVDDTRDAVSWVNSVDAAIALRLREREGVARTREAILQPLLDDLGPRVGPTVPLSPHEEEYGVQLWDTISRTDTELDNRVATAGTLDSNVPLRAYRLSASHQDTITVVTTGATDLVCRVFNASGGQIAFNDDGGPNMNCSITTEADAEGVYFVTVQGYGGATGAYEVTASAHQPSRDDDEGSGNQIWAEVGRGENGCDSDRPGMVCSWPLFEHGAGARISGGDSFRVFRVFHGGQAAWYGTVGSLDTVCRLFTPEGVQVDFDNDGGSGRNCAVGVPASSVRVPYILTVQGWADYTGQFQLVWRAQ